MKHTAVLLVVAVFGSKFIAGNYVPYSYDVNGEPSGFDEQDERDAAVPARFPKPLNNLFGKSYSSAFGKQENNALSADTSVVTEQQWLSKLRDTIQGLLQQFQGFVPYLLKLIKPMIEATIEVAHKFKTYASDYINTLPKDTLSDIQNKVVSLGSQLLSSVLPSLVHNNF